nr:MFS transporter [uncultured Cohaesibacter sp.]
MRPILAISLAALPTFISGLEQSVMSTSAASIAQQIGIQTAMAWILAAYFIAASVATPIYGRLGDRYGPIRVLIFAILVFGCGSLLATQANSFWMLVIARFIQGLGGGGLISLPQTFLSQTIEPRVRAAYQGYLVAVAFMANTFGPVLGGFLIGGLGWQSIFWLEVPLALVAIVCLSFTPKQAHKTNLDAEFRFDWLGALFLVATVSSLMMLTQSLSHSASAAEETKWAIAFVLFAVGFAFIEKTAKDPLLPFHLLKGPIVWKSGVIVFLYGFLFTGLSSFVPVLLRSHFGLGPQTIGIMMMPLLGAVGVGSIITGQLVRRSGKTMIFPSLGLAIVGTILASFTLALHNLTAWQTAIWMGVNGLFMGSTLGVVQVALQIGSPTHMIGRATAFIQLSRTIGASLGAGISSLIYFRADSIISLFFTPKNLGAAEHSLTGATFYSLPFALLFCFFALIAATAAFTASRCKVPKIH